MGLASQTSYRQTSLLTATVQDRLPLRNNLTMCHKPPKNSFTETTIVQVDRKTASFPYMITVQNMYYTISSRVRMYSCPRVIVTSHYLHRNTHQGSNS